MVSGPVLLCLGRPADKLDYLHFAGWKDVEIVDLCARDENGKRVTDDQGTVLFPSPRLPDHLDPLWVVCATKAT